MTYTVVGISLVYAVEITEYRLKSGCLLTIVVFIYIVLSHKYAHSGQWIRTVRQYTVADWIPHIMHLQSKYMYIKTRG